MDVIMTMKIMTLVILLAIDKCSAAFCRYFEYEESSSLKEVYKNNVTPGRSETINDRVLSRNKRQSVVNTENLIIYDYESLRKEYYAQNNEDEDPQIPNGSTSSINAKDVTKIPVPKRTKNITMEKYCNVFLYIRVRVFSCLHHALINGEDELAYRCFSVLRFWAIVYIILAIYFWCTQGWCCCCLSGVWWCKPFRVIKKARNMIATLPPGVDVENGVKVYYKATDLENKCYAKLEESVLY